MIDKQQLIAELEEIRIRMTVIYLELGNPKDCAGDMVINEEIEKFKKQET